MAQGLLPFHYVDLAHARYDGPLAAFLSTSTSPTPGMTALGGFPLYVDLAHAIGLPESIRQNIRVREHSDQGWTDPQMQGSCYVTLNITGDLCEAR